MRLCVARFDEISGQIRCGQIDQKWVGVENQLSNTERQKIKEQGYCKNCSSLDRALGRLIEFEASIGRQRAKKKKQ